MVTDEQRQKMIVRQSSLKLAVDLLNSEQERSKSEVSIPFEIVKLLTMEIERFVWELAKPEPEKKIDMSTGKVVVDMTEKEGREIDPNMNKEELVV